MQPITRNDTNRAKAGAKQRNRRGDRQRFANSRRLGFEALEDRQLLAVNLLPFNPGWDDKIVVSNKTDTSTNDTLTTNDTLYVDWCVTNDGDTATTTGFYTVLYLDGAYLAYWRVASGFSPEYVVYVQDYTVGTLKAGDHTLKLVVDAFDEIGVYDEVAESNETDNTYTASFTVTQANTTPIIRDVPDVEVTPLGPVGTTETVSRLSVAIDSDDLATYLPCGTATCEGAVQSTSESVSTQIDSMLGFAGDLQAGRVTQASTATIESLSLGEVPLADSPVSGTQVDYLVYSDWGGTWVDAEKDDLSGDDLLCWAASAANGLVWSEWGFVGGMTATDEIFQYFQNHWTDEGSLAQFGWTWWFNGENYMEGYSGWSQDDGLGGNFYSGYDPDVYIHSKGQGDYANWYVMSDIDAYLSNGYAVGLGLFGSLGHAVTCWGFSYDSALSPSNPNYYTGVWISDSDDNKYGLTDGATAPDVLHYYAVTWDSSNGRYSIDSYYEGAYIGEVDGLAMKPADSNDLWAYTRDGESADSELTFTVVGCSNPNVVASISENRYLEITPLANCTSTVTVEVSDPGGLSSTVDIMVTASGFNDPPAVSLPSGALTYTESSLPMVIDAGATVTDIDSADFDGGVLTVSYTANGSADDRLAIQNQGIDAGQIGISGSDVTYGSTTIGTLAGGSGVTPLVVTFNANATLAAVQALLRNVTYANVSETPSTETRTVQFVLTDGDGGTSVAAPATIHVIDNKMPVLASIGNRNVDEEASLSFTVTATDGDVPGQTLSYSLDATSLARGMTIDAATGAFAWTPNESQGGADYEVTITVTDDGPSNLSDSETFTITVNEVNTAPLLAAISNQSVDEDVLLSFTVTATDEDIPEQTLSYSLDATSLARGMTLDAATGAFAWTPSDDHNGETYEVTVTVTDSGSSALSDSKMFTVTIRPVNDPPSFVKGRDQVVGNDAGPTTVRDWATSISAGAANESEQNLTFELSTSDETLFDVLPEIDDDGTLTFTPKADAVGVATVTVTLRDDGDGENTSIEQTFTLRIAEALGAVDLQNLSGLDTTEGARWYSLQTVREGYLTLQALDSAATVLLYDQNMTLVGTSKLKNGSQRTDVVAGAAGGTYYLALSGGDGLVDLRVMNLVAVNDGAMSVSGTANSDSLEINAANGQIVIDDVLYSLSPTSISFDGGEGPDAVRVLGTSGNDQFTFDAASGQMTANSLTATLAMASLDEVSFDGLAGKNLAVLWGTGGNDMLVLRSTSGQLTAGAFQATLSNTATIVAYGGGGSDTATLYDSAGNDVLTMSPNAASMAGSVGAYSFTVNGFANIYAYGTSGYDRAALYDSSSNDVFDSKPTYSRMYLSGVYTNRVTSFDAVYAYASTGYDMARLYDSSQDDYLVSTPTYNTLSGTNYYTRVKAFDYVYTYASEGNDRAKMYDSAGNDRFSGSPTDSIMQGVGYLNRAKGFEEVLAYASTGTDKAYLYDSSDVDTLKADNSWVKLYNTTANFSVLASGFDTVNAYSSDTAAKNITKIGSNLARNMLFMLGAW